MSSHLIYFSYRIYDVNKSKKGVVSWPLIVLTLKHDVSVFYLLKGSVVYKKECINDKRSCGTFGSLTYINSRDPRTTQEKS